MKVNNLIMLLLASFFLCTTAQAEPILQVDIAAGTYDTTTETIVATSNPFTVYALLNTKSGQYGSQSNKVDVNDTFYLSIALIPKTGPAPASLGSFDINFNNSGVQTINVTSDMTYGTPPQLPGKGGHDIFATYYYLYAFQFDVADNAPLYDTQTNPGGLNIGLSGDLLYRGLVVDVAGLDPSVVLHFDLFAANGIKAPYSHDGESSTTPIPAPALLLGTGLIGLVGFRGRRQKP